MTKIKDYLQKDFPMLISCLIQRKVYLIKRFLKLHLILISHQKINFLIAKEKTQKKKAKEKMKEM